MHRDRLKLFVGWGGRVAAVTGALLLLASCDKPLRLQVVLENNEQVSKGTVVYVDNDKAGEVQTVEQEGGERVANLLISSKEAREKMRIGALRIPAEGRILIKTDTVKEGAKQLPRGARVPTASKIEYLVTKYSSKSTMVAVLIGIAALVVLWLVFRSLVGTVGMILCVVLASTLTQVVHPYVVPWVERAMAQMGPPPVAAPAQAGQVAKPPSASEATTSSSTATVVKKAENTITEVMNARPSPLVVTWSVVFLVLFITLNMILGRACRSWRK